MSSTVFAPNMAAAAGAARLRTVGTLGCCSGWAIGFAGTNPPHATYADAMKRSTRHLGGTST